MKIKPIDTEFDGYKFRSRLEARWAVFFKEIGLVFQYELEGFKLPSGKQYLPDFYLPSLDLWVEIKPNKEAVTDYDLNRYYEFIDSYNFLLIIGVPTEESVYYLTWLKYLNINEFNQLKLNNMTIENLAHNYPEIICKLMKKPIIYLEDDNLQLSLHDESDSTWLEYSKQVAKRYRFEFNK